MSLKGTSVLRQPSLIVPRAGTLLLLGVAGDKLSILCPAVEILHVVRLLVDDPNHILRPALANLHHVVRSAVKKPPTFVYCPPCCEDLNIVCLVVESLHYFRLVVEHSNRWLHGWGDY